MNTFRPCYLTIHEVILDEVSIIVNTDIPSILPEVKKKNNYLENIIILILFSINTYHALSHPNIY